MPSEKQPAPLIVIEGIDGSGKGTQAALLTQRLQSAGVSTELFSFPRYQSTFFGARIGEFLNGKFGTLNDLHPFLVSLLYAGDRFESRQALQQAREDRQVVVLDRYVPSNIAHQTAKATGLERKELQKWIEQIEYNIFELPRPDLVILLDIPIETSQQLIQKKQARSYTDKTTDLQEADTSYLDKVREVYRELAAESGDWKVIPVTHAGAVRTMEEINDDIWNQVQSCLADRE